MQRQDRPGTRSLSDYHLLLSTSRARTLLSAFALALLLVLGHFDALGEWWKTDDPQILLHAIRNSPAETLFSPSDWRTLQTVSFTPLLTLSFDLDHALFGLDPFDFYAHQVAAVIAATLLLFVLLRPWCGGGLALLAAAAVGVGPAMTLAAESLMIRHYVEGLAFALAALIVWRSGEGERFVAAREVGAAVLFLLAVLAKEVYAPLPLLFVAEAAIARVGARRIALRLIPTAAATLVYLGWRLVMLGSWGGYGEPTGLADLPGVAWSAWQALFASSHPLVFLGAPLLTFAGAVFWSWKSPRAAGLALPAVLIVVALPLFGVSGLAEARYGVVPVVAAVAVTAIGLSVLPRPAALAGGVMLFGLHAAAGVWLDRNLERAEAVGRAEGLYVWSAPATAPPLLAGSPAWYLTGLRDLRRDAGGGEAPRFVLSLEGIAAGAAEPEEVVRMEGMPPEARRLDPGTTMHLLRERSSLVPSAPLEIRVAMEGHVLRWDLGPAQGSHFVWLTVPEYDEYAIPPSGARRVPAPSAGQKFRIRRELPDGRWMLSPVFDLPAEGEVIAWTEADAAA